MNWNSKRVEAILEQALIEDRATSDVTTALTIDPRLRASATVLAKQDCVLSGLGCIPRFLTLFARLDKKPARFEVISHPEMFDGVRVRKGQAVAVIRHNARTLLGVRARHPEFDAADERHCDHDAALRGRAEGDEVHAAGHAKDCAGATRAG